MLLYIVLTFPFSSTTSIISFLFLTKFLPAHPTTVPFSGTSLRTTVFAPTFEPFLKTIGPRILAPAPIITSSSTVGCLFPFSLPVPPKVTP